MSDIKKIAASVTKEAGLHTITIKDKKYTIELLPARQALAIATELFKVVLPSFAAWGDASKREGLILPEDDNLYTEAAMLLVNQMDKISVADLVEVLTQNIYCNGEVIDVDKEFRGNIGGFLMLLEFIFKENIGPLFTDWLTAKGLSIPSLHSQTQKQEDTSS